MIVVHVRALLLMLLLGVFQAVDSVVDFPLVEVVAAAVDTFGGKVLDRCETDIVDFDSTENTLCIVSSLSHEDEKKNSLVAVYDSPNSPIHNMVLV